MAGIVLDLLVSRASFTDLASMQGEMLPDFVKYISAIALLAVIGYGILARKKHKHVESA